MRLIISISIFILPFITCITSKSLVCPRTKKDALSSLDTVVQGDRIQTGLKKKPWSKRAKPRRLDPVRKAIDNANPPIASGIGFKIARTKYYDKPVTLKSYESGTAGFVEYKNKWQSINALMGFAVPQYNSDTDQRFHLILGNAVPNAITEDDWQAAIKKAFRVQTGEMPANEANAFLTDAFTNPQEFFFKKSHRTWIATPIYFATQNPIDKAISMAIQFADMGHVFLARTTYKNIPVTLNTYTVTLSTYTGSTDLQETFVQSKKWEENGLLVGTAVSLMPHGKFYMILGNFVPQISLDDMHIIIKDAPGGNPQAHDFANPQEFAWIHLQQDTWTAIRIHFSTQDPISKAIESAEKPFAVEKEFSIARTKYNDKEVTLKTYFPTAKLMPAIHADCIQWMTITGLIATRVRLARHYTDNHVEQIYLILDNSVPPNWSLEIMQVAIVKYLGKDVEKNHDACLANPQEYKWTKKNDHDWIPKPIEFKFRDNPMPHA